MQYVFEGTDIYHCLERVADELAGERGLSVLVVDTAGERPRAHVMQVADSETHSTPVFWPETEGSGK